MRVGRDSCLCSRTLGIGQISLHSLIMNFAFWLEVISLGDEPDLDAAFTSLGEVPMPAPIL